MSSTAIPAPYSMSHAIILRRSVLFLTALLPKTTMCFRRAAGGGEDAPGAEGVVYFAGGERVYCLHFKGLINTWRQECEVLIPLLFKKIKNS
jgi:hypothetical protein